MPPCTFGTGRQPPWRAAAARQEARHLAGSAGMATHPRSAATGAALQNPTYQPDGSAAPTILFAGNTLERTTADLLVHEAPGIRIALHIVAVRSLELRPIIHRPAPEAISRILCHY